jgi:hypothetical protein
MSSHEQQMPEVHHAEAAAEEFKMTSFEEETIAPSAQAKAHARSQQASDDASTEQIDTLEHDLYQEEAEPRPLDAFPLPVMIVEEWDRVYVLSLRANGYVVHVIDDDGFTAARVYELPGSTTIAEQFILDASKRPGARALIHHEELHRLSELPQWDSVTLAYAIGKIDERSWARKCATGGTGEVMP